MEAACCLLTRICSSPGITLSVEKDIKKDTGIFLIIFLFTPWEGKKLEMVSHRLLIQRKSLFVQYFIKENDRFSLQQVLSCPFKSFDKIINSLNRLSENY